MKNDQEKAMSLLKSTTKSNYQIAKDTKISEATIGNYVNGKTRPTPANAKTLIDYFSHTEVTQTGKNSEVVTGGSKNVGIQHIGNLADPFGFDSAKEVERLTAEAARLNKRIEELEEEKRELRQDNRELTRQIGVLIEKIAGK